MLLETRNNVENNIIIYSRNSMDENYNFRIIFKNDPEKHHRIISFKQVKKLISEYFPKTLIVYRILSNFPEVSINSKHGCTILVNEIPELVFTDPVFAVKAIEEYLEYHPNVEFRFRVQKVGYSVKNQVDNKANYKEEFCFDLNIDEAINQKDENFVGSLIEIRIESDQMNNSAEELKRNMIFAPENRSSVNSFMTNSGSKTPSKSDLTKLIGSRDSRLAEGALIYNNTKLNLGKLIRKQEKKKQIEMSFQNDEARKTKGIKDVEELRIDQKDLRVYDRGKEDPFADKDDTDLKLNFSEDEDFKSRTFKKIQNASPLKIRKVHINENGTETEIKAEKSQDQKDNLFSKFLKNLTDESFSGQLKEYKQSESEMLKLFKSIKNPKSMSNQENNKQVILKSKKYGDRE